MVTSQNMEVPATVPKAKAKPKTGGRRGRGGGSRTARVKAEPIDSPSGLDAMVPVATPTSGRAKGTGRGRGGTRGTRGNRGGRPRGRGGTTRASATKRKKNLSDDEDAEKDDTDASENYAPLTQSRSGRRITQATTFANTTLIDLDPPTDVKPPPPLKTATSISAKKTPTAKEKDKHQPRRKAGEAAVCKNCTRGHSPLSNMIVFCDGCNTPWHQYCHNPPIGQEVIRIQEREWFCGDCSILRREKTIWIGNISAERMTLAEKRRYLLSLPSDNLISLLLHATTLHPSLPIFSAAKPPTAEAVQLVAQVPNQTVEQAAAEEELYDFFAERELLPYPKAGHGVAAKLPPEMDDLGILVDEDVITYSHSWGWTGDDLFGTGFGNEGLGGWGEGGRVGVGVGA